MRDSVPSVRYSLFVMYFVYGESGSSLLIESTDSMIYIPPYIQIDPQLFLQALASLVIATPLLESRVISVPCSIE